MLLATIPALPEDAGTALREALDKAAALGDPNDQAWAMRHAFDAVGEMGGGPALTTREVRLYLSLAIRLGAPAYNAGDHRGIRFAHRKAEAGCTDRVASAAEASAACHSRAASASGRRFESRGTRTGRSGGGERNRAEPQRWNHGAGW